MKIRIENDLFDVAKRLKEIDSNYRLYFNCEKKRFEIFGKNGLEVVVPFSKLDNRTIVHTRKTRLENKKRLIAEIEKANEIAEKAKKRELLSRTQQMAEEILCKQK